jgi:deferrochelatase/peroxidase EfeB
LREFTGLQIQEDPLKNVKQKAKVFAAFTAQLKRKPDHPVMHSTGDVKACYFRIT